MKLIIELSERQLEEITKALDLYSRILCGQIEEVPKVIQFADFTRPILTTSEDRASVKVATETLKSKLFPEVYPASHGICSSERLPSLAAVTYDIYQVILKMQNPNRDIFKTSSKEKLPIIKRVEV